MLLSTKIETDIILIEFLCAVLQCVGFQTEWPDLSSKKQSGHAKFPIPSTVF